MKKIVKLLLCGVLLLTLTGCAGTFEDNPDVKPMVFKEVTFDAGPGVCTDFPADFVSGAIGKEVSRAEQGELACTYFLDEEFKFITVSFYERSYVVQESGLKNLGFYLRQDERIKVDHQIASVDNETIWSLYLRVNDEHFYSMNYSAEAITDEELINLAGAISEKLVNQ